MIIASFTVRVTLDQSRATGDERAIARVERYLYHPLVVLGSTYDRDLDRLSVVVAGLYRDRDTAERLVQYQRDRLSSGLLGSTDPIFTTLNLEG